MSISRKGIQFTEERSAFVAKVILVLRIILPVTILIYPFWMSIILQVLDGFDYVFIRAGKLMNKKKYQLVDKSLDLYYLFFMAIVAYQWQHIFLLILFAWRLIGFVVVAFTRNRKFFLLFPNVFEWVFNITALAVVYNETNIALFINDNYQHLFILAFLLKIVPELYIHVFYRNSALYLLHLIDDDCPSEVELRG